MLDHQGGQLPLTPLPYSGLTTLVAAVTKNLVAKNADTATSSSFSINPTCQLAQQLTDRTHRERREMERVLQAATETERLEAQRMADKAEARQLQEAMVQAQQENQERAWRAAQAKRLRMGVDIPKLGDPKGISLFLEQFERDMLTFGVPPAQWTTFLRPLLDERSIEYSRHLPQETQEDFALVSAELTKLHGISPEFHGRRSPPHHQKIHSNWK